jgi:hypothetical protein
MERKSIAGKIEEAEGNNIETFERFYFSDLTLALLGLTAKSGGVRRDLSRTRLDNPSR